MLIFAYLHRNSKYTLKMVKVNTKKREIKIIKAALVLACLIMVE